jgi:hypothetical protein
MNDHGWLGDACREKLQEIDFLRGVNYLCSVILCGISKKANLLKCDINNNSKQLWIGFS